MDTYEKKYKEALERARELSKYISGAQYDIIFPELKESENDRIKKAIHIYLDWLDGRNKDYQPKGDYSIKDMIAWLEKQGDKEEPQVYKTEGGDVITYSETDGYKIVEPKFKVGDFIVNDYCMGKVIELTGDAYLLDTGQGIPFSCEHNAHLWTIADAKDGDVLVSQNNKPFIYNGNCNSFHIGSYCGISVVDRFNVATEKCHWTENANIQPATKEQCDLLFQKMHKAGYEWDAEKKELKKIEQKFAEWSEENEHTLQGIIDEIQANKNQAPDYDLATYDRFLSWLKSLKQRNTWKPSDAQMASITCAVRKMKESACYDSELVSLLNDLKKLTE